ncbi:hypothetical protein LX36DRAFT_653089 [Colletotrichum falcatum]|nr:hypothetical protein LX36DRAFT_653089 [Colletotrichum falcatum]
MYYSCCSTDTRALVWGEGKCDESGYSDWLGLIKVGHAAGLFNGFSVLFGWCRYCNLKLVKARERMDQQSRGLA